jgi:Rrf2 family protein
LQRKNAIQIKMRINTKVRYGLRALIEIANSNNVSGILQKDIANNQEISLKYLDSIVSSLKVKGLIANTKGKGGYKLTRLPEEITMLDIYTAFEKIEVVECLINKTICNRSSDCVARCFWNEFNQDFKQILLNKNLQQIINQNL